MVAQQAGWSAGRALGPPRANRATLGRTASRSALQSCGHQKGSTSGRVRRPRHRHSQGGRRRARLRVGAPGEVQAARRARRGQRWPGRRRHLRGRPRHGHAARPAPPAGAPRGQRQAGLRLAPQRRRRRGPGGDRPRRHRGQGAGRRGARGPGGRQDQVRGRGGRPGRAGQRGARFTPAPGPRVRAARRAGCRAHPGA